MPLSKAHRQMSRSIWSRSRTPPLQRMSVSVPRCCDTTDPGLGADDRHGYRHPAHRRALRARSAACAAEGGGRGDYGMSTKISGIGRALPAAVALGGLALPRTEPINALWIVTAAVCV